MQKQDLASRAASFLALAAAPTFAILALLTAIRDSGAGDMTCMGSSAPGSSLVGGMVPMYLLMSAFHAAPWLKRISRR